jgi:glutamate 5-kinase
MERRIVVKLGSQLLCDPAGELNLAVMEQLAQQIGRLAGAGWQVLLVSSGAVAAGRGVAGARLDRVADTVARKQVLAATGQVRLMERYRALFEPHGLAVAQVLASKSDFQTRRHYLNMRGCIEGLLSAGILPVVNENDVVSITELMFTDNDELAGLIAGMVKADLLCLLSTVPGVYDGDPEAEGTQIIENWDDAVHRPEDVVQAGASALGRGGMHSKLNMARRTARLGTTVVIGDGAAPDILERICAGQFAGTRFPAGDEVSPTRRWLASADAHAEGSVTVNQGAAEALLDRSRLASLLPVGIESVQGPFQQGDVIQVCGPGGEVLGCGRAAYGHEEAGRAMGRRGRKPLIHYDYLYLMD